MATEIRQKKDINTFNSYPRDILFDLISVSRLKLIFDFGMLITFFLTRKAGRKKNEINTR